MLFHKETNFGSGEFFPKSDKESDFDPEERTLYNTQFPAPGSEESKELIEKLRSQDLPEEVFENLRRFLTEGNMNNPQSIAEVANPGKVEWDNSPLAKQKQMEEVLQRNKSMRVSTGRVIEEDEQDEIDQLRKRLQ